MRLAPLGLALLFACGADEASVGRFDPGPNDGQATSCTSDPDCGGGLICVATRCVSPDDLLPPDTEEPRAFGRPAATERYLYALSPDTDTVAVIDAQTLEIAVIPLPSEPLALERVPDREAVLILSREGRAATLLELVDGAWVSRVHRLDRRFTRVSVAPDARRAIAWTHALDEPDAGAEGLVAIVALDGEGPARELAAGYRHTDLVFRADGAVATLIGKDEVTRIELARAEAPGYLPARAPLPDGYTDVLGREVVASADGRYALMRSFAAPELAALSVDTGALARIPLPALATDLDIVSTGTLAVAALRASSQLALIPLPEALSSSSAVRLVDVRGASAGQLQLSADARFAATWSAQDGSESFAWVDLVGGGVRVYDRLRKRVRAVGIAADGAHAVVLHAPTPDSTNADPYEREVDLDEGYSLVDLARGVAQLKRTDGVAPSELVFAADGVHAVVTLRDDARARYAAEIADLRSLVIDPIALPSAPQAAGALPGGATVWVTELHRAGRIGFIDTASGALRSVTGFHLNAGIE